jgi:uncharacterized membrane protein YfcA
VADLIQSGWNALDLQAWQAVAAIAAVLLGATISGLTGFGFGLVIVPIMLLLFPPPTVVVLTASLAIASGLPILLEDRGHIRVRIISPLLVPALIGLPIGVQVLTGVDTRIIKLIAGVVVLIFAVLVARGFVIPGIRSRIAPIVAGLSSGILGTSTGMSGPPVVLFLTDRTPAPRVFRASITFYFSLMNLVGILLVVRTGAVGGREFGIAAALLPVALVGRRIGQRLHDRVDQDQFRRITFALLILTGTSGMVTALAGLI